MILLRNFGLGSMVFLWLSRLREKLTDIAAQHDAKVTDEAADETVLDLLDHHDPLAACRDVLAETKA